jgi:hypothetical protein
MPEYLVAYKGTACDMYHGFQYDVEDMKIVTGENASEAYESAKTNQKTIESKLFLPEIKIDSIREIKPANLVAYVWTKEDEAKKETIA